MRGHLSIAILIVVLGRFLPATVSARSAQGTGTVAVHLTVGGAVHDRGTVSATQGMVSDVTGETDFNGCAQVKNTYTGSPFGAYRFKVQINVLSGINMMLDGIKPKVGQEVEIEVYNFRASVSTYSGELSVAFVIGGHLYFTGTHTVVTMRNGGLDGTIKSRDLLRSYPSHVSDLTLQASWHCSTLFHVQGTQ